MTEVAGGKHPQRCDRTSTIVLEIIARIRKQPELKGAWDGMPNAEKSCLVGDFFNLVSSAPQPAAESTRYMSEEQRKYILSFKEEDPLLMAYAEGQKAAEQRIKDVIAELESTIKCNERWQNLEPYYQGVNAEANTILSLLRGDGKS